MSTTTDQLTKTLSSMLSAIDETLELLQKASDAAEKQRLADIVKTLCGSQEHLVRSIDISRNEDFDLFDDDFDDDYYAADDDLNDLMDTKQIQFKKKGEAGKKGKKRGKSVSKLEDEDLPF